MPDALFACHVSVAAPYYEREGVTLYLGDCRDVLVDVVSGSADVLVTDPPYGQRYESGFRTESYGPIAGDDGDLDVTAALTLACKRLRRARHAYVFGPDSVLPDRLTARTGLVWDKSGAGLGLGDLTVPWASTHERITFAMNEPSAANRKRGNGRGAARLRQGSVLAYPRPNSIAGRHPTDKPVPLLRRLIESSSLLGEVVLDPFAGSGSTLVAAIIEGRRAVGVELDERWAAEAARRLDAILDWMALVPEAAA